MTAGVSAGGVGLGVGVGVGVGVVEVGLLPHAIKNPTAVAITVERIARVIFIGAQCQPDVGNVWQRVDTLLAIIGAYARASEDLPPSAHRRR